MGLLANPEAAFFFARKGNAQNTGVESDRHIYMVLECENKRRQFPDSASKSSAPQILSLRGSNELTGVLLGSSVERPISDMKWQCWVWHAVSGPPSQHFFGFLSGRFLSVYQLQDIYLHDTKLPSTSEFCAGALSGLPHAGLQLNLYSGYSAGNAHTRQSMLRRSAHAVDAVAAHFCQGGLICWSVAVMVQVAGEARPKRSRRTSGIDGFDAKLMALDALDRADALRDGRDARAGAIKGISA
ncbi:hypothetical protein C8R45DRAFT_921793 [Mycena sanguinolenta]|nr:hypothetical protein C8R45DRAFT_921793 [Mycena sanguinolenta]